MTENAGAQPLDDRPTEARSAEAEPLTLPGYEVHHLLGGGASGQVWLAREERSGELVALKRLRPGRPGAGERLLREASLLAAFRHDHVVRLRSVESTPGGLPVLVLDHAAGGSLAALLARRGRLDPGEVVTIAAPLAQALAEAHGRGLVHGDVTPANVLFDADGKPLLADLGVGRLVTEPPAPVEGTADYLDPAVAAGGLPEPAADVHALAAACQHMLTGRPPYAGESLADVLRAAAAGERTSLRALAPQTPPALLDAVEAALDADPTRRPSAATLAAALLAAAPAQPVRLRGLAATSPAGPGAATAPPVGPEAAQPRRWARGSRSARPAPLAGFERRAPVTDGAPSPAPGLLRAPTATGGPTEPPRPTHAVPSRLRRPEPTVEEPSTWQEVLWERVTGAGRSRAGRAALGGLVVLVVLAGGHALTGWGADRAGDSAQPLAVAAAAVTTTEVGPAAGGPESEPAPEQAAEVDHAGADDAAAPHAPAGAPAGVAVPGLEPESGGAGLPGGVWGEVVDRLDASRAAALEAADPSLLDTVYVEGSAALAADRAAVGELRAAGLSVRGARHELREVTVLEEQPGGARLLVVDVLPAHEVLDGQGQPVERRSGRGPAPVQLDLVDLGRSEGGEGWRISAVTRP